MSKPNCYECKWRGEIPGDAHIACKHPKNGNMSDPMSQLLSILGNSRMGSFQMQTGLKVVGNPTGIKHGWFNFPFNFDPTWLMECDGITTK